MRLCTASVLLVLASAAAGAQATELQPGAKIRIDAPGVVANGFEGLVVSRTRDSLVVASQNLAPITVPLARVTSLEINRGKSRSAGAKEGMKWGIPIVGGLGLVVAATASDKDICTTCRDVNAGARVSFVVVMTAAGALYGAGIGALIGKERWEKFDLGVRTSVEMRNGRPSFGFRYAF